MALSKEAKAYWCAFGVKILENLASVKVWIFMFPFVISTIVLWFIVGYHIHFMKDALSLIVQDHDKLVPVLEQMKTITDMFIAWCTFTVSLGGTVIIIRETFKVRKLKALNEEKRDNSEEIKNMSA